MDARTAGRRMTELLNLTSRPGPPAAPTGSRPRRARSSTPRPPITTTARSARSPTGIAGDGAAMGRPACAMIPADLGGPTGVTSLGCIGNRVYTGLGDDELYFTIPGPKIGDVVERLATVVDANRALETYHEGRRAIISPP